MQHTISADDLTGDAWKIDEAIDKLALESEADRRELKDMLKEDDCE